MTDTRIVTGTARKAGRDSAVGFLVVLIVLVWSGLCAAQLPNPSFEDTYDGLPWPRPLPTDWWHLDHPSFSSYCTDLWSTDGDLSVAMFSLVGQPVYPGDGQSFFAFVDLTDVGSIEFDVRLAAYPAGAFEHFEASLLIDGVPFWSADTAGVYLNQQVNVAGLEPGWHSVEIYNTALEAGTYGLEYWTLWDNFRLVEPATVIPAEITLDPGVLNPRCNGKWITCYLELDEGYDVRAIDGATVTLDDIPAVTGKYGWAAPQANACNVADYDADGVLERMVKFEREAVQAIVEPPETTVTIKGQLTDGTSFEGTAVLRVLDKKDKGRGGCSGKADHPKENCRDHRVSERHGKTVTPPPSLTRHGRGQYHR